LKSVSPKYSPPNIGAMKRVSVVMGRDMPPLIEKFSIKSMFDAPCGDFNWMKLVLDKVKVDYVGADIVKPLID
jgi:hypothetical protein